MRRYLNTLRGMMTVVLPTAGIIVMITRAATSWGPMNLIVLAGFVLTAATILACVPIIPHRPFWAGFAIFGLIDALIVGPMWALPGMKPFVLSPLHPLYRRIAENHYGPAPNFYTVNIDRFDEIPRWKRAVEEFVTACHAVAALGIGLLGGGVLSVLARHREASQWDRDALPERPLDDFLLPPLKVDRPFSSK